MSHTFYYIENPKRDNHQENIDRNDTLHQQNE
jgi:hypothetical protein